MADIAYASTTGSGPFKPVIVVGGVVYVKEQTFGTEEVAFMAARNVLSMIDSSIAGVLATNKYVRDVL